MQKFDIQKLRSELDFSSPIQIRFSDIDGYLHVNNGIYFNYYEHSRAIYLLEYCGWNVMDTGTVVASITIDYLRPIHLEDQVEALVACTRVGNTSFELDQFLIGKCKTGEEVVYSRCRCTLVSVDMKSMKPVPVPEVYRVKLQQKPEKRG
ncbi:thioesterase family protein [Algoriphagus sp. CAU 1675]|uniref:acyl-CoA thioesterase n=1 Tax=Algoriphagus sp. CAU 1675 TaxID=3032597 RepID=UPI0023DA1DA3|nr:thioesterase family protein [Algoriphagus sp. CAU 1675]MDF2159042.1 thioesterase family protein [Algoriphagus sp. CAU 1675]